MFKCMLHGAFFERLRGECVVSGRSAVQRCSHSDASRPSSDMKSLHYEMDTAASATRAERFRKVLFFNN